MSTAQPRQSHGDDTVVEHDPVESIIHAIPIVLPAAGAVLIFLLAFIAVYLT